MLFWLLAVYYLIVMRFIGHSSVVTNPIDSDLQFDVVTFLRLGLMGAVIIGVLFGLIDIVFERKLFRDLSYGKLILTKSLIYISVFVLALALLSMRNQHLSLGYFDFKRWKEVFFQPNLLVPISYMATASILLNFIRVVNLKFGPGNLWYMLIGKFYRPRQDKRILMFLDLKSSTATAERLGHIKYSELIQDCFSDLAVVQSIKQRFISM